MIIPYDINPNRSLYYLGSKVIKILDEDQMGIFDILILYEKVSDNNSYKIPLSYLLYALDWLYLINLIRINENGGIERCT